MKIKLEIDLEIIEEFKDNKDVNTFSYYLSNSKNTTNQSENVDIREKIAFNLGESLFDEYIKMEGK